MEATSSFFEKEKLFWSPTCEQPRRVGPAATQPRSLGVAGLLQLTPVQHSRWGYWETNVSFKEQLLRNWWPRLLGRLHCFGLLLVPRVRENTLLDVCRWDTGTPQRVPFPSDTLHSGDSAAGCIPCAVLYIP